MKLSKIQKLFPFILFLLALASRTFYFPHNLTYGADQAEFLLDGATILTQKPLKLIGIYVSSRPVGDKYFFIGSQTSYFIALCQLIFGHNPLLITYAFVIINSLASPLFYSLGRKLNSLDIGIASALIYSTLPFAINLSQTIWNPSLQLPLIALFLWFIVSSIKKPKLNHLMAGFILGNLIAIEYSSILLIPFVLLISLILHKTKSILQKLQFIFFGLIGTLLGLSNLILFELKHNFYNSRLIIQYLNSSAGNFELSSHHLIPFLPLLILISSWLIIKLAKSSRISILTSLAVSVLFYSDYLYQVQSRDHGYGMPPHTTYQQVADAAQLIATDHPTNFNVAQIIDGDSRSFSLRYLLAYHWNLKNQLKATDAYNASDTLYVLHYQNQPVESDGPYELHSFAPKRQVVWQTPLNQYLVVSKLTRVPTSN